MLRSIASCTVALATGFALMATPADAKAQYGGGVVVRTPNFSLGIGQVYRPYYPAYPSYYGGHDHGHHHGHYHGPIVPATPHYTPGRGWHLDPVTPSGRPIHTPGYGYGGGYGSGYGGYRRY